MSEYIKIEPKEAFKKWWKKDYKAYLSMNSLDLAEQAWQASRESLFAELSEDDWRELEISKDSMDGWFDSNTELENILDKLGLIALATRKGRNEQ